MLKKSLVWVQREEIYLFIESKHWGICNNATNLYLTATTSMVYNISLSEHFNNCNFRQDSLNRFEWTLKLTKHILKKMYGLECYIS